MGSVDENNPEGQPKHENGFSVSPTVVRDFMYVSVPRWQNVFYY